MKVLFICNMGKHRSKTAAELFASEFSTEYAGLYSENPVSNKQIEDADLIVVMEEEQRHEIASRFPSLYLRKRIINLNITDVYAYNDPHLIDLLKIAFSEKIRPLLE